MTRWVVYSPSAERHLKGLYDRIAAASSPETPIATSCRSWTGAAGSPTFPMVGVAHDDIRPGLRTLGYRRRAVIAFTVTEASIEINGIHYGGRGPVRRFELTNSPEPECIQHKAALASTFRSVSPKWWMPAITRITLSELACAVELDRRGDQHASPGRRLLRLLPGPMTGEILSRWV